MTRLLDAFHANTVVVLIVVAVLGGLSWFLGLKTPAAFLFMLLGLMIVLWDAHTDDHLPAAPSLD